MDNRIVLLKVTKLSWVTRTTDTWTCNYCDIVSIEGCVVLEVNRYPYCRECVFGVAINTYGRMPEVVDVFNSNQCANPDRCAVIHLTRGI
jgi:hypothetical protein